MCAWVQVQNIVLTRSRRFIVLLLSDASRRGNFERITVHMNTIAHINKQIISPLLHFSPSHTLWAFSLSQHWSFVITDMISLCTDTSSGSSDGSGMEDGWRMKGGVFPSTAGGWETNERQEAQIKLRRVSENRSGGLLECVLNTAAPWGIREAEQQERFAPERNGLYWLSAFKVTQLSLQDSAGMLKVPAARLTRKFGHCVRKGRISSTRRRSWKSWVFSWLKKLVRWGFTSYS